MTFMQREAEDSFFALLTADGMEKAGAVVVSITYNGEHKRHGALMPCPKFLVWARVKDHEQIKAVDDAISDEINKAFPER